MNLKIFDSRICFSLGIKSKLDKIQFLQTPKSVKRFFNL